ncbi:MAG: glycine oxidase ThiO [Actinomycetota bacterium]
MTEELDTIVVGAGVIGLAIAWQASQQGQRVLVVDRDDPPRGASWVAAGMLAPVTEASFGEERLLALNLESARRYPAFVAGLEQASGMSLASPVPGTLFVALDRDRLEALHRLHEFQRSLGLEVEWLTGIECRRREPSLHSSTRAGVLVRGDREIDPRRLGRALRIALERSGGWVRVGVEVTEILVEDERATGIRLAGGEQLAAHTVVLAAGSWSGLIRGVPADVTAALRPVKGQILRLRPRMRAGGEPLTRHIIRTDEVYLVPRRDGELVVGATVEEQGFDTAITAGAVYELLRAADEAAPGIRELELAEASAGLRPATPDNAPLLGPTSIQGLVAATGHYRNGVLLTPVTADAIARLLVTGELDEVATPFSPGRFTPSRVHTAEVR